jgi:hypothetical protein
MEPIDFWNIYMQGMRPADFMSAFDETDPVVCVTEYVRQRPAFYGIVRQRNWRETFAAGEPQFTRESVRAALITHLEETRPEWETVSAEIRQQRQEERRRRIEDATRLREAVAAVTPPAPEPEPEPDSPPEELPQPEAVATAAVDDISVEPVETSEVPVQDAGAAPEAEAAPNAAD